LSFIRPFSPLVNSVRTHLGYIPFEGRLSRPMVNKQKFLMETKRANLQPVNKITYTFDPMTTSYHSMRNFMFFWNTRKIKMTNVKMLTKVEIVDDRRDPTILMNLNDGRDLEIRAANLTELEIATIVNHYLLPLVKEEETLKVTKGSDNKDKGKGGKKR